MPKKSQINEYSDSNINIYSTFDNEHNWEDLCIQLRNEQHMHFR